MSQISIVVSEELCKSAYKGHILLAGEHRKAKERPLSY